MKTIHEIGKIISDAIIAEDEAALQDCADYFKIAGESSAAFTPAIEFNEKTVANAQVESSVALPMANSISRELRRIKFNKKIRSGYNGPIIVSEGDSWYQYPFFLEDTIDCLMEDFAVCSLGAAGARLAEMSAMREYVDAIDEHQASVFLLSGGGNDMLDDGRLSLFLRDWASANQDVNQVIDRSTFEPFLDSVMAGYDLILSEARSVRPGIQCFIHGYGHARPRKNGRWLGGPLEGANIPKQHHDEIIRQLIDLFNERQIEFASNHSSVTHIDCRGLVGKTQWKDELHPNNVGFKKVAGAFKTEIDLRTKTDSAKSSRLKLTEFARVVDFQRNASLNIADFAPAEEAIIGDSAIRLMRHVTTPRELIPGLVDPVVPRESATDEHPCSSLRAWHARLEPEDYIAFGHYKDLIAEINEPDEDKIIAARREMMSGAGHSSIERILGESNIYQVSFLSKGARAAKAIGRITVINKHGVAKGHGTGFLVAPGLLLTNNHVLYDLELTERSFVLFDYAYDADDNFLVPERFDFDPAVFFTDAKNDFTFVGVKPTGTRGRRLDEFGHLVLVEDSGKALKKEFISIIQHADALPKQVAIRDSQVIGRKDQYVYYTTDTNTGTSGAPVVNDDWFPVALHHRTVPDIENPCRYVANRGIRISSIFECLREAAAEDDRHANHILTQLDERPSAPAILPSINDAEPGLMDGEMVEAYREPFHEADYSNRRGFAPDFLGEEVPMPMPVDPDLAAPLVDDEREFILDYQHFSIIMHRERRLAMVTAANIDTSPKAREPEPGKTYTRKGLGELGKHDKERWFIDPRISPEHQLPDRFFEKDRQSFDKGHLVRRDIAAWGISYAMVKRANGDTFHTTNCSPQVKEFNRSNLGGEWGLLENRIASGADKERVIIFSGPVLHSRDRKFSGLDDRGRALIKIPSRYWKIIVAKNHRRLQCFPFLLEQDLSDTDLEFSLSRTWRKKMSNMSELAAAVPYLTFPDILFDVDEAN